MKKVISRCILLGLIPVIVIGGAILFHDRQYAWITLCVVILSCVPFFLHFERSAADAKRMVLLACMTALTVLGRMLFAMIPAFKPVTAMVVITGMYFGSEAGFMTGALAAVLSNFYFGQGPWTPFQMFSWGILGFIAGMAADSLKRSKISLTLYAVLSGILYSLLMDIWTVLEADGGFNLSRYAAALGSAVPFTAMYALSNAVFLWLLARPIGKILDRIKTKYGL